MSAEKRNQRTVSLLGAKGYRKHIISVGPVFMTEREAETRLEIIASVVSVLDDITHTHTHKAIFLRSGYSHSCHSLYSSQGVTSGKLCSSKV